MCGHCKNLAPKYEQAASQLKGIASLAKVDCTSENDICSKHEVKGYPTLKIYNNNRWTPFEGQREVDVLVRHMKKLKQPSVTEVTAENFKEFSASDKVVIIAFLEPESTSDYVVFKAVAEAYRNEYSFGATTDKSLVQKQGIKVPSIVLFKKFDEGKNTYEGAFDSNPIEDFIRVNAIPLMDDVGPENYASYADSGLPLAYLFVGHDEHRTEYGPIVENIAKDYKGKINFVYIDGNKYGGHAANLNLKQDWPAFAIQLPAENKKYPYDQKQPLTAEGLRTFIEDFDNGKLEPSLKSEEIPASQNGPVTVIVGKQFEETVNQPKNVLVEFYAPWCGHCKKLAPIYDELGEKYKGNPDVVIAKMDATANDLPPNSPITITGFPTIKLFKADNTIVDYDGDRSLNDFVKFIDNNIDKKPSNIKRDEL